jgi:hypothetical protein
MQSSGCWGTAVTPCTPTDATCVNGVCGCNTCTLGAVSCSTTGDALVCGYQVVFGPSCPDWGMNTVCPNHACSNGLCTESCTPNETQCLISPDEPASYSQVVETCDATGHWKMTLQCAPYTCATVSTCKTSCSTDSDCASGYHCLTPECHM